MATEQQLAAGVEQGREYAFVNKSLTQLEFPKFTGLKLQKDIILGDFIFNTIDDFGVVWVVTDIEGWWEPPEPEMPDVPRGYGDGSYDVQGRYLARNMTLSGVFLTPDPSLVEAARDRLTKAVDLVYKGTWLLAGTDPIRASYVRLSGGVKIATVNARGRTEFQVPLKAFDPIKYSWNDSQPDGYDIFEFGVRNINNPDSGKATLINEGNYPVPILIEISGPISGPATIFNKTSNELIIVTSTLLGSTGAVVENKQLNFNPSTLEDVATLTTREAHGFSAGREITVSRVGTEFDGTWTILSVPTETTLTYAVVPEVSTVIPVAYKSLTGSAAKLEVGSSVDTSDFSVGDRIVVSGVDDTFDGNYTVSAVTSNSISYTKTRARTATVTGRVLVANQATLTTASRHGFRVGESVVINGVDATNFNGTYIITSVSADGLKFSYSKSRTDSKSILNTQMTDLIITVNTTSPHGYIVGEPVEISGLPAEVSGLDGRYEILSTPNTSRFTVQKVRSTRKGISAKAASGGTATLTTSSPHGFVVGERVIVQNVDSTFNGTYTITSTPSPTAFTYARSGTVNSTAVVAGTVTPDIKFVTSKSLTGNVATLTTLNSHGIVVGESVTVSNVDSTFNGTYTVSAVTESSFSYLKTASNIALSETKINLSKFARSGTTVTITTATNHGFSNGNQVLIQGLGDGSLNGYFTITAVPAANRFTYTSSVSGTIAEADAGDGSFALRSTVTLSGDSATNSPPAASRGVSQVNGNLPFRSSGGTATVGANIERSFSGGFVVKPREIKFTPGVTNPENTATIVGSADILEIDTLDREVAFNGEVVGARGRIDVLADFIQLQPGENEIEFEDSGNPEGEAIMRIFYRSGWMS